LSSIKKKAIGLMIKLKKGHMKWIIVLFIMVNGPRKVVVREKAFKYGKMAQNSLVTGNQIKQMVKEGSFTLTGMCMKENGTMTKRKEGVPMSIWMEQST
jgi:hypothetical protein